MKTRKALVSLVSLFWLACALPAHAVTRYADNGAAGCGSSSSTYNPNTRSCGSGSELVYSTVSAALQAMAANDIVTVRAGLYPEKVNNTIVSGTGPDTDPTKFSYLKAYPGESVEIRPSTWGGVGIGCAAAIVGAKRYIWIDGITFDGRNCAVGASTLNLDSTGGMPTWIRITNSVLRNSQLASGMLAHCVLCIFEGNEFHNNGNDKFDHGVYMAVGNRNVFRRNKFHDNRCFGMQVYPSAIETTVEHNEVWDNQQSCTGAGFIDTGNTGVYRYNTIREQSGNGITVAFGNATKQNMVIEHNSIFVNGAGAGISFASGTGHIARNNLIIGTSQGVTIGTSTGTTVTGNIHNSSTGAASTYWTNVSASTRDFTLIAGSPAINAGNNIGLSFCGSAPDVGAHETCPHVSASINGQSLDVTFGDLFPPLKTTGTTGWSVGCSGSGCGSPTVANVALKSGATSVARLTISGITGGSCQGGQVWTVSYNSSTGLVSDSHKIGNSANQHKHSFTNFAVTNACSGVPPPTPTISNLTPDTLSIQTSQTGTLTVVLNATQTSNTVVTLTSSSPSVATVPATVTVPANQLSASFVVTAVSAGGTNVTASLNATSDITAVTVTGTPPPPPTPEVSTLLPATNTVNVGGTLNLTVTINAAQASNTTVSLSSSAPTIATVPGTVTVLAGNTSAVFAVTPIQAGNTTITATLNGSAQATVSVVQPPPPPPPGSPEADLPLDSVDGAGNTADVSGHGRHGTAWATYAVVPAKIGNGVEIQSAAGRVTVPYGNGINPSTQSLTFAVGVYVPAESTTTNSMVAGWASGSNQRAQAAIYGGLWTIGIQASGFKTGSGSNLSVVAGWNRLCLQFDSATDTATLYNNGVQGVGSLAVKPYTSYSLTGDFVAGAPDLLAEGRYIYDAVKIWSSVVSCADDYADWEPPAAQSEFIQQAHQFERVHLHEGAVVSVGSLNGIVRVIRNGGVALVEQVDCTPGPCNAMSPTLHYNVNGGPFTNAVPDTFNADGVKFWGTGTTGGINTGATTLLSGALTHEAKGTSMLSTQPINVAGTAGNSTTFRRIVAIGPSVPVDTVFCFKEYNQNGQPLESYNPPEGACVLVAGETIQIR